MIKLDYHYTAIRLDPGTIMPDFIERVNKWWRGCVMAWAEATASGIHIDTGMSISSLAPLMDAVDGAGAGRIISGRAPRRGVTDMDGVYHTDLYKSPELGAEYGESAFVYSEATLADMTTYFEYKIAVYQWAFWEDAWQANEEGTEALRHTARTTMDSIAETFQRRLA